MASGKYFKILDSDDFYVNSNLIKLVEKLKGTNADLVFTNYRRDKERLVFYFDQARSIMIKYLHLIL